MGHDHDCNHTHGANIISFFIIASYMIVEVIGGFVTNSLALLSDTGQIH